MIRKSSSHHGFACVRLTCAFTCAILASTGAAHAQTPGERAIGDPVNHGTAGTVTTVADSAYDRAGGLWRFLFGDNWRPVWSAPITVPVLDLGAFAGGIEPYKSGGNQTRTLHFKGKDGRHYVFRSVGKSVQSSLGPDLQNTPVGDVIQDQNSANHPSSATIADVVATAAGVLHPSPSLYVLPDDERLGKYRSEYANMLGHVEIKPDDVPEGVEQFGGADDIEDADDLIEALEKSTENRLDAKAYLRDRLVDAIMGDFDRGADQWDFAEYERDGIKTYVPIARDRDWAFMRANGFLMKRVRHIYAKIGSYDPSNEQLRSITFMTHEFDRSHLVSLPWSTWQEVAAELRSRLSDDVIEAALRAQPASYNAVSADRIRAGLRARRDGLQELAREFYEMVNTDADVFATDGDERADIDRNPDGTLRIRITGLGRDGAPAKDPVYFDRTFLPSETDEVRVYMQEGNDQVVVRGAYGSNIKLRVVGGAGDDMLVDSTGAQPGELVEFYDASGDNRISAGPNTDVHTNRFVTAQPTWLDEDKKIEPREVKEERRGRFQDQWRIEGADFTTQRMQTESTRFWGETTGLAPAVDIRDGAGLVLGAGLTHTAYGFRSLPFSSKVTGRLLYGADAQRFGVDFAGEVHPANRDFTLAWDALLSGFESQRFYGLGNDSPLLPERDALVMRNELRVEPTIMWGYRHPTQFSIGPVLRIVAPRFGAGTPADVPGMLGTKTFTGVGAAAHLIHSAVDHEGAPHRGYRGTVDVSAFEPLQNGDGAYGRASASVSGYIPLSRPTLALRVGGERAFGDFPLHESAQLGGRMNLRGYHWERYTGDTSLFGNAELRAPITRATLLVRGDVGIIALADAGRVWLDGASPGGWHHSLGGGLSFSSLSKAVSVVYAHGEENRIYLNFGLPF